MTLFLRVGLVCLLALPHSAWSYATPEWLFTVDVPVQNQTVAERERVAQEGLLRVLTRITGLTSVPRTPEVTRALQRAQNYYNEFVFFRDQKSGENQLRINYQRDAILDLVRAARLPIWWTNRPVAVAWVVIEEAGERRILGASDDHPLSDALVAYGRSRGFDIKLPVMDLQDHSAISAADVWGGVSESIDFASSRYGADIVMTLKLRSTLTFMGRQLQGVWNYWHEGEPFVSNVSTDQFEDVVATGVDPILERMLALYSVHARSDHRWELKIGGMSDVDAYVGLMSYLEGLDFVASVAVSSLTGDEVAVVLETTADSDQLIRLLTVQDRLRRDNLYLGRGVRLRWVG